MPLNALGADDEAFLEGWYRGARLKGQHVPTSYLPRDPLLGGIDEEGVAHPVRVGAAPAVPEHHPVALSELVQVVEEHAAPRPPVAHAMPRQVDVPLRRGRPRQGGVGQVGDPLRQRYRAGRVEDGGVVDANRVHGEAHYRTGRQIVVPRLVGSLDLTRRGPLPPGLSDGRDWLA